MSYTVSEKPWKIVLSFVGLILINLAIVFPLIMYWITDNANARNDMEFMRFGILFAAAMNLLFIALIYSLLRPRIKVCGDEIICYPQWKKKSAVKISDITGKRTGAYNESMPMLGGAVGAAVTYAAVGGKTSTTRMKITYFVGEKAIISINSGMKNAELFDATVRKNLGE